MQAAGLDDEQRADIVRILEKINAVLGVFDLDAMPLTPEIDALVRQRETARQEKNWAAADQARKDLLTLGINVFDTPAGPVWEKVEK